MSDTAWMDNLTVKCRCGQQGVITGVEGSGAMPDNVWVNHLVGLRMQTHIHRGPQMSALMAQVERQRAAMASDAAADEDAAASTSA